MSINIKIGNKDNSVFNKSMNVHIKRLMISDSVFFLKKLYGKQHFCEKPYFSNVSQKTEK